MRKIAVIILNWNGKKDTLECLASLKKVDYPNFFTVVVDNGSTDSSVSDLRTEHPEITLLETGKNLGFAEGNNVGIRYALEKGADFLFLLNNDTVVDPHILMALVDRSAEQPSVGIFGCSVYLYEKKNQFDHLGGLWNPKKGHFDLICNRSYEEGQPAPSVDYVCGCAFFVRKEVFETVGLLESRFFLIWEEADFCFRAKRAGFEIGVARQAKLWHKVSASFVGGKPHTTYFWWRGRLFWIERNCKGFEKCKLYLTVLIPEIIHIYKLRWLKNLQLLFPKKREERKHKILQYRAALQGVKDYLLRRFGNAPPWIYKR